MSRSWARTAPAEIVPATTVPRPSSEKLRSTARRKRPLGGCGGKVREALTRCASTRSSLSRDHRDRDYFCLGKRVPAYMR